MRGWPCPGEPGRAAVTPHREQPRRRMEPGRLIDIPGTGSASAAVRRRRGPRRRPERGPKKKSSKNRPLRRASE